MKIQANCMDGYCGARIAGNNLDGINCPICKGPVNIVPFDGKPGHINYYLYQKHNKFKPNNRLSIDVTANTDNLSAKLRSIAKHTTALADELDAIDQRAELDDRVQD